MKSLSLLVIHVSLLISMRSVIALSTKGSSSPRPRTFFITGATDGIGKFTSQKIASEGGHALLVHGRKGLNDPAVTSLIRDLERGGAYRVSYLRADLNDLREVEKLADDAKAVLKEWQGQGDSEETVPSLDVLINNAGVFDPEKRHSMQGYDSTMAINVLAPYVITRKLLPCLVRGDEAQIITTSSISQSSTLPDLDRLFARIEGSNYDTDPLPHSAHTSYSHSKLGDLLFTVKLAKVLANYQPGKGLQTNLLGKIHHIQCLTMDPGTVNTKMLLAGWGACGIPVSKATNTYKLATSPDYAFGRVESGSYHFGFRESSEARNDAKLNAFWKKLEECTGCSYDDLSDCL